MNKFLLALNILLVAAVGFLFYKQYGSGKEEQPSDAPVITQKAENLPVTSKIAFIRADSINSNYLFLKEKTKALEQDEKKLQATLDNRMKALEKRYLELQQKAATMSQSEIESAQVEMQQSQQEIEALRYKLASELDEKRANLQKDFFDKVNNFLAKYNKTQNFDYILSYAQGGQVLLAKDTLDITKDVLNGLNKEYQDSKAVKK